MRGWGERAGLSRAVMFVVGHVCAFAAIKRLRNVFVRGIRSTGRDGSIAKDERRREAAIFRTVPLTDPLRVATATHDDGRSTT